MRGGRENIGGGSSLQMATMWYRSHRSQSLLRQADFLNRHLGAFHAFTKPSRRSAIFDVPRLPSVEIQHQLFTLLAKCRELTYTSLELESAREIDEARLRQFSDERSVLECQLGRLRHDLQDDSRTRTDGSLMLNRAMCLAALFYAFFYLRRFMMGGRFMNDMIAELVDTLDKTEEAILASNSDYSIDESEAALWATTIASRFAQTSGQVHFASRYAIRLAHSLDCTSKDQWAERLDRLVWAGDAWDSTLFVLIGGLPS